MEIPKQLQKKEYRFLRLKKDRKEPLPSLKWKKETDPNKHKYDDEVLQKHKGNYGVIGGNGNLRIIDIDDKILAEELIKVIDTFAVQTCGGTYHFYIDCDYETNRVFTEDKGEYRASNYYVVGPGCYAIDDKKGHKGDYTVVKDIPIKKFNEKELMKIIKPYLRAELGTTSTTQSTEKDPTRSAKEYREVIKLIGQGKNKEEVFREMDAFSKWSSAPPQYKELTYNKAAGYIETQKEENPDMAKSFLKENRLKYESLGCGFHDGVFYFGTKLFREGKPYSAVVTSDKKIYINTSYKTKDGWAGENQIKFRFDLKYKDEFFDESLDNILTKEAITKWVYKNTDDITLQGLHDELVELFKKYIYFENKIKYSLLACYRIAGFFMPVWKVRARLFSWAEMGSAKSRLTQLLHNTGFNSVSLGDWTLPYLKAIIESTRGETHIDDYETLDDEKKKATERQIKVGFMRGFKAGKMSEGKRKPEVNDLFNTTTINNTEGLDFISIDRCITIRIPKIAKKEYDSEPNFEDKIYKELRDKLYICGLKYPNIVKEEYKNLKSDKIRGRLFSIIKPELTIAKLISKELYDKIEEFWVEEIDQRVEIDFETDWVFLAYKQIYKLLSTLPTNTTLSTLSTLSTTEYFCLKEIAEPVGKEIYEEEEYKKKKRGISIIVGRALSRNPIFKKREVKGVKQYSVNFDEFRALLKAKRFLRPILEILEIKDDDYLPTTPILQGKVDSVDKVVGKTCAISPKKLSTKKPSKHGFIGKDGKFVSMKPKNISDEVADILFDDYDYDDAMMQGKAKLKNIKD